MGFQGYGVNLSIMCLILLYNVVVVFLFVPATPGTSVTSFWRSGGSRITLSPSIIRLRWNIPFGILRKIRRPNQ